MDFPLFHPLNLMIIQVVKRATQPSMDWGPVNQSDRKGRYTINVESRGQELQEHIGLPRTRLYEKTHNASHRGSQAETPKEDYYDNEAYRESFQNESF